MVNVPYNQQKKQVYVIFSVDTEHDIIQRYTTKAAGWSMGIPLLCKVFDASGLRGRVCWLIEYNAKDGILAANPSSEFYVKEFSALVTQIKSRGDDLGLHPSMVDWIGGERQITACSYNDPGLWDYDRRYQDPEFVMGLITSATKEFAKVFGIHPVGCRTGHLLYATHLATALAKNGIYIDSSVSKSLKKGVVRAPNAYYAASDDIRRKATTETNVLEIPTVGYITNNNKLNFLLRLRSWYLLHRHQPVFLSYFIHNWQAIASDGSPDRRFLDILSSNLRFLSSNGAYFLSWREASEVYRDLHRNG